MARPELRVIDLLRESELPAHEASRLLRHAAGGGHRALIPSRHVAPGVAREFRTLVAQRSGGHPLQYLEGTVQFGPIELLVDGRALVPRPETERLWEIAVEATGDSDPRIVVDLCTGSGNLALALAYRLHQADVYGTDLSADALALARENGRRLGLTVTWLEGDLFEPLPERLEGRIDLLVANPPYVSKTEWDHLPADVRDHEPSMALVAGQVGDEVLARIGRDAARWLAPGGILVCEIAEQRSESAVSIMAAFGAHVHPDLTGRPRFVMGAMPSRF